MAKKEKQPDTPKSQKVPAPEEMKGDFDISPALTKDTYISSNPLDISGPEPGEEQASSEPGAEPETQAKPEEGPDTPKVEPDYKERYENLEQEHGRQANELGQLRKLVDRHLLSQPPLNQPEQVSAEEINAEDLIENPSKVIGQLRSQIKNELTQEIDSRLDKFNNFNQLQQKHADHAEVVNSPEFVSWIEGSVQQGSLSPAMVQLGQNDPATAATIIDMYKAQNKTPQVQPPAAGTSKEEIAKRINTKRKSASQAGGLTPASGNPDNGDKVFSRAELMNMSINDPQKYALMQPEIMKAYAEGRVK